MKLARNIAAALVLFAWLFAGAHLALEHGSVGLPATAAAEYAHEHDHGNDHHHDHDSVPTDEGEHHHDFSSAVAGQWTKTLAAPVFVALWSPIFGSLTAEFDTTQLRLNRGHECSLGESPPDERASGWLLVVHTARPVRGPSLTA